MNFCSHQSLESISNAISSIKTASSTIHSSGSISGSQKPKYDSEVDEYRLRKFINNKDWQEAKLFLQRLPSSYFASGRNVVYIVTETCRRSKDLSEVYNLLKSINTNIILCKEDDIMPLLAECADNSCMHIIQPILSYLETIGTRFTAKVYSTLFKGYGRQNNEAMIDRIVYRCSSTPSLRLDVILLNSIMDAYIRCNNPNKAIDLLLLSFPTMIDNQDLKKMDYNKTSLLALGNAFNRSNLRPNVRTYNILLKTLRFYNDRDTLEKCIEVAQNMKLFGVSPDDITVNTMVDACVRSGNLPRAEEMLSNSTIFGTYGSVEAFTAVIAGYSNRYDIKGAFRVLDKMMQRGITPNAYTFTSLMNVCMLSGNIKKARALLKGLSQRSLKSSEKMIPQLLSQEELTALHGSFVIGLCQRFQYEMNRNTMDSSISTLLRNTLTEKCIREEYLYDAQCALLEMDSMGIPPDIATFNSFIQAMCSLNPPKVKESLMLLQGILRSGIQPDKYTYSILFKALGKAGYVNQAINLFESLPLNAPIDTTAINSLIRAFVGGPQPIQAIKLFYEFTNKNESIGLIERFIPDKYTFTILFIAISEVLRPVLSSPFENFQPDLEESSTNMKSNSIEFVRNEELIANDNTIIQYFKNKYENIRFSKSIFGSVYKQLKVIPSNLLPQSNEETVTPSLNFRSKDEAKPVKPTEVKDTHCVYDNSTGRLYEYPIVSTIETNDTIESKPADDIPCEHNLYSLPNNSSFTINLDNPNDLIQDLYRKMRFEYIVQPDDIFINVINSLYSIMEKEDKILSVSKIFTGSSKVTARLIFEDLIISGASPKQLLSVMKACCYTIKQEDDLLSVNSKLVNTLRSSPTSHRIFKKYKWNEMDSGWSPFF